MEAWISNYIAAVKDGKLIALLCHFQNISINGQIIRVSGFAVNMAASAEFHFRGPIFKRSYDDANILIKSDFKLL